MTAHDHASRVEGCFRCELTSDELGVFQPGDGVVYRPPPGGPAEDGEVIRVNDRYVFVRFVGDRHAKAVAPWVLEHLRGGESDGEDQRR